MVRPWGGVGSRPELGHDPRRGRGFADFRRKAPTGSWDRDGGRKVVLPGRVVGPGAGSDRVHGEFRAGWHGVRTGRAVFRLGRDVRTALRVGHAAMASPNWSVVWSSFTAGLRMDHP